MLNFQNTHIGNGIVLNLVRMSTYAYTGCKLSQSVLNRFQLVRLKSYSQTAHETVRANSRKPRNIQIEKFSHRSILFLI